MRQIIYILTAGLLFGLNSCCDILCERQKYADLIIQKMEGFKVENGRLPEDVTEMRLDDKQMHLSFYTKISENEYEVWYGTDLGVSKIYNSKTKTWREEG